MKKNNNIAFGLSVHSALQHAMVVLPFILAGAFAPQPARGDNVTVPLIGNKPPTITINVTDKNGQAVALTGIIDTGNDGTTVMNQTTANNLGLAQNDHQTDTYIGVNGQQQQVPVDNVPANQQGSANNAQQGANNTGNVGTGLPSTVDVAPNNQTALGNNEVLLGSDWLDNSAYLINQKENTFTLWTPAQSKNLQPLRFQQQQGQGNGAIQGANGPGQIFNLAGSLYFANASANAQFAVSSAVSMTLISAGVAASLGITGTGSSSVSAPFGTFTVGTADVQLTVFAAEGPKDITVGILPDSENPNDINVLGDDWLSGYADYEENPVTGIFSADPVPEPCALALLGFGAIGLLASTWRCNHLKSQASRANSLKK